VFGAVQFPRKRNQIRMTAFVRLLKGQPFLAKLRFGRCSICVYRVHFLFDGESRRFWMGKSFGDVFRASVLLEFKSEKAANTDEEYRRKAGALSKSLTRERW
jgi:hypothetical protein